MVEDDGLQPDHGTIVDGMCKMGDTVSALNLLRKMEEKKIFLDIVTYNCMINGLGSSGRWSEAQLLLQEMLERMINPDVVTFSVLINALVKEDGYCGAKRVDDGMELLHEMSETRLVAKTITYNTLIHGFCQVGDLNAALDLLHEMLSSDALEMFKVMQKSKMDLDDSHLFNRVEPDVQTYNILISGLINEGKFLEDEELYEEIPHRGIVPSTFTYKNSMVDGLCKQTRLDEVKQMFVSMGSKGFSPDVVTFNTLINGYCKMCRRGIVANEVTYITLIHGFRKVGNINGVLDIFQEMISSGSKEELKRAVAVLEDLQMSMVLRRSYTNTESQDTTIVDASRFTRECPIEYNYETLSSIDLR
ncbi:hypothetical protein N665_0007s0027 [Sinapis alba]|nr:hypothetical protein N665_0007s0027 [Sinapis alba]